MGETPVDTGGDAERGGTDVTSTTSNFMDADESASLVADDEGESIVSMVMIVMMSMCTLQVSIAMLTIARRSLIMSNSTTTSISAMWRCLWTNADTRRTKSCCVEAAKSSIECWIKNGRSR